MEVRLKYDDDKGWTERSITVDCYDTWSADYTIAFVAAPLLKQLAKTKHGAPFVNNADVPEQLRATEEDANLYITEHTTDDKWFDRWDWVLGEMIFAMDELGNDKPNQPEVLADVRETDIEIPDPDTRTEFMKRSMLVEVPGGEEALRAYEERVENGCRLFGAYFQSLWD